MIVKLNGETYRVQFIKEVEPRKRGKTTIKTICRIFRHVGEKCLGDEKVKQLWEEVCNGASRQNPADKYNHLIGKKVALRSAMVKVKDVIYPEPEVPIDNDDFFEQLSAPIEPPTITYHFDRIERSVFANALEAEFDRS